MGCLDWVKRCVAASVIGGALAYLWDVSVEREKWAVCQLDRRDNIELLERVIEREQAFYGRLLFEGGYRWWVQRGDVEAASGRCFRKDVLSTIDEVISLPSDTPAIHVGKGKRNTVPSKLFLYGLAGVLALATVYSVWEEYKRFKGSDGKWAARAKLAGATLVQTLILSGVAYGVPFLAGVKNFYKPWFQDIQVEQAGGGRSPQELAMTMAHEYAHFAQDASGMKYCRTLWEGHANQVALEVGKRVYERTKDAAYVQSLVGEELDDLRDVYITLCRRHGVKPAAHIEALWDRESDLDVYALGSALISVWVERHGPQVYDRVMRNDFGFLDERDIARGK